MRVKELLQEGYKKLKSSNIDTYILDTQILLSHILDIPKWKLLTIQDQNIDLQKEKIFKKFIKLRQERIPVAYIIKQKEFFGINFYVDYDVLIPRPETEILVEQVLKKIECKDNIKGIEVGIGSGAISISLLKNNKNLSIIATDISEKAINIAYKNAKIHNVEDRIKIINTNILENIKGNFDFIVSNPPYITENEYEKLQPEVKKEPKVALVAKDKGIYFYKKIIEQGINLLKENGFFAFEVGYNQAYKVEKLLIRKGLKSEIIKDLQNIDRVVMGVKNE